eukprot:CAMPEP_0118633868 /NCGR_PEP_ID=MMETSP0785-20121206/1230_1 /TAXON_ID=91992 /ORGANISM="Bolidomonas pacifica, Strain CCMP 1866" /LENGTH=584 /DNA_ID=CAMNT_0006524779 /DNA_START=104 /DNA_END=1855 /DNA_ORIENTATION=-
MSVETPSDEVRRKWLKPDAIGNKFSHLDDVITSNYSTALNLGGADGATFKILKQLDSYDDENFLLELSTGSSKKKYLVKVHNGVESEDASIIDYQNSIMMHLNTHPSVTTTAPLMSNDGKPFSNHKLPVLSSDHSPATLTVRLLTYIEGTPMAYKSVTPQLLYSAGKYLADIDSSLDNFSHIASERFHAWDQKNTTSLREFVKYIQTPERQKLVNSVIDAFEANVLPDASNLRQGVLQSDFNDANIIIGPSDKIAGVIDFGDSVKSWRVLDVTVAMAYAMLSTYGKTGHSLSASGALLAGFNAGYPLNASEIRHLRTLVCCRLACSATLGAYSYSQDPENKYLLLHAEPCWRTLEMLWSEIDASHVASFYELALTPEVDLKQLSIPDPSVPDHFSTTRSKKRKISDTNTITFVTGNKKKLEEVKKIMKDVKATITNHKLDLPELQGDPLYVSEEKCKLAVTEIGGPVITEDTSLCYNALNGMPGPYIKWFLEKCGHEGLNKMLHGYDDKTAYAQTVVAYCEGPGKPVHLFDGRTNGKIVPPRGPLDFGWDPVFECSEGDASSNGVTYAEMDKDVKNRISHRGRA